MCFGGRSSPPPAPEPTPPTPPVVKTATTGDVQNAPASAEGRNLKIGGNTGKKRLGRGSLRIPLASSGLSGSGLNFPNS